MKLCIVGFGNSGQEFCKLLLSKNENVEVVAIATKSKGNLLCHQGLNINEVLNDLISNGRFGESNPNFIKLSTSELIKKSGADVMIELSTLSIKDGQPAIEHIETAFKSNMHVITANKGPIAWYFKRLEILAKEKGLEFLYETTVMDGTPIFNLVKYTLPGCKVLSFKGILNSTTNFILEEMENGKSYEDSVKEAQRRGFAEADPTLDVNGWDAAAKTAALVNVLLKGEVTPLDIERRGISSISKEQIIESHRQGKKIKLICEGYIKNNTAFGKVSPVEIPITDILSTIDATSSILCIKTDLMGEICIVEKNPEIKQTAYGIYSDLLSIKGKHYK